MSKHCNLIRAAAAMAVAVAAGASPAGASAGLEPEAAEANLRAVMHDLAARGFLRALPEATVGGDTALLYPGSGGGGARSVGPDVIVGSLPDLASYGHTNGISAFAVGTTSCNIGDVWLNWIAGTNQHPVIGQNMYRYKVVDGAGRFEQIGQSWLKHGFLALSGSLCFNDCIPTDGTHLGVHCSDPYSAGLNGSQSNLGPRSDVNASTGFFPFPFNAPPPPATIGRRLQVRNLDLDPAQNPDAVYFVEGQYIAADDAAAGNDNNNASYRRVNIGFNGSMYLMSFVAGHPTVREKAAIHAWQELDPEVAIVDIDVPPSGGVEDGRFTLAYRVTDLGDGTWRYEYAVHNLNSHASGGSFSVPIPPCAEITNAGFHDVDSHSGEPYDLTDWAHSIGGGTLTWSTESHASNPNANALRWGTMYNFRFDANVPPAPGDVTIGLFRPWTPGSVSAGAAVPSGDSCDCPADFDGDGDLTPGDFSEFRNAFIAGNAGADFNGDGDLTPEDFVAFRDAFLAGCG